MNRILVTGACGQIGSALVPALRDRYGGQNVVATDIEESNRELRKTGPFEFLDVTQRGAIGAVVDRYEIDTIYHLAAILSATGERKPQLAWNVNVNGLYKVLEIARERRVRRVFCPSSIAVFGPETPKDDTPQNTVLSPTTMYGISKVNGELLGRYYFRRFGLDVRGVRYPGIISSEALPGGGTTDYAVEIFYQAIENKRYTCFLREDTVLPMMYMPDCVKATIEIMEVDAADLEHHANYNVAAMSFRPSDLVTEIQKHIPEFVCEYNPDYRQEIADSWPRTIDDSAAREEWGWQPDYDLAAMAADMLEKLSEKHAKGELYAQSRT
ncbi:MAG: NAD-dependent epimerase/dehydratase family protein [Anaerolineae bacterium]